NLANGNGNHRVIGSLTMAATEHNRLCVGQPHEMLTDAQGLLIAGMGLALKAYPAFLEEFDLNGNDLDHWVAHQVSHPHTEKVADAVGIDKKKIYRLYPTHGNIGPAGIPTVLSKSCEEGNIKEGDRVVLMGIGSGLNCMLTAVQW
ncbi:MAG: 3-oxoacyl-ACP synthase III, partial [Anaerolineae bacterium]|nr:3-oxoacyl-ACP synthase III [Anaerolineae bacterium]